MSNGETGYFFSSANQSKAFPKLAASMPPRPGRSRQKGGKKNRSMGGMGQWLGLLGRQKGSPLVVPSRKPFHHGGGEQLAVGAAFGKLLGALHHLAHVRLGGRARFGDRLLHDPGDLLLGQRGG